METVSLTHFSNRTPLSIMALLRGWMAKYHYTCRCRLDFEKIQQH